jgi:16S rRNA G966 N2-methylase RsmD
MVVGIEQSGQACRVIAQNWQQVLRPEQQVQILRGDVCQKLLTLDALPFDCIYFDPPYASDLYLPVLQTIARRQMLTAAGEIAVEFNPNQPPLWQMTGLILNRIKTYGNTALGFCQLDIAVASD